MRTSDTKQGRCYSPDDGDYAGFLALLRDWTADLPFRGSDLEAFAGKWAVPCPPRGRWTKIIRLRTPQEWVRMLKQETAERSL